MAEIEKGLPNVKTKLEVPAEEKLEEVAVQEAVEEQENPKIEVTPEDDGGVTLDFEPGSINVPGTESHFDNLADLLPDDVLEPNLKFLQKRNYKKKLSFRKNHKKDRLKLYQKKMVV